MVLNHSLVEYAKRQSSDNIPSVAKMCFLLCDRNNLPDDEIIDLIDLAIREILGYKDYIDDEVRIIHLVEISKIDKTYHTVFCETAIAHIHDFSKAQGYITKLKEYIDDLNENNENSDAVVTLYKRVIYAMFSTNNRALCMAEEQTLLNYIFN